MAQLIDHLAALTGFRDRELLDESVVKAIKDVLEVRSVAIYRSVGEAGAQRWLTRAHLGPAAAAAGADPPWTDFSTLPSLSDASVRSDCLRLGEVVSAAGDPHLACFPITTERHTVGVLEIESEHALARTDHAVVRTILRIFGNFLDLLDRSERDVLTGLLNRQTFEDAFDAQSRRPLAGEHRAWLAVIDIDHFKRINDAHGHLIGDEVLLLLSRLLRSSFGRRDRLYRFGGEEFVVLLEAPSEARAGQAFERLRANVEGFAFPQVGRVTVSLGFTEVVGGEVPAAAFSRADKALYFAKQNGRNRIVSFDALVRSGQLSEARLASDIELF